MHASADSQPLAVPGSSGDSAPPARGLAGAPAAAGGRLSGAPTTFEAFYEAEAESVHRAVGATVLDASVAREAVDEAMARAFVAWDKVGRYESPAGWVYRTAVNWGISRWRKVRRERPWPEDERFGAFEADFTDGAPALTALAGLGIDQRAVVVCRILLGLDTRATAVALGLPEGTVKSRLARALTTLRLELEDPS